MAESGGDEMASSWWGGWLQSAKEKSKAALEMVRKDLTEFGTTMQSDAGHVVEMTSNTLKDSLKAENTSAAKDKLTKGLNNVLERLSQALVVPPDDEGQIPITASSAELYDRTKARIHAMQLDPGTYLNEPSGARETYGMWCEGFELDDCQGQISDILVTKAEVRALYTKLVPSQVSHVEFWRRYFYRLHQMDVEQARKEALMKRADSTGADDSISWDDDWSGDEAAAEDSGSDWEKLPRPTHHHHHSPSLSPSLSPSTSPPRAQPHLPPSTNSSSPHTESQQAAASSAGAPSMEEGEASSIAQPQEVEEHVQTPVSSEGLVEADEAAVLTLSAVPTSTPTTPAAAVAIIACEQSVAHSNPASVGNANDVKDSASDAKDISDVKDTEVKVAETGHTTDSGGSSDPRCTKDKAEDADSEGVPPSNPESFPENDDDDEGPPPPTTTTSLPPSTQLPASLPLAPEEHRADHITYAQAGDKEKGADEESVVKAAEEATAARQEALSGQVKATEEADAVQDALSVEVGGAEEASLKTTVRGDLVVVGSDHGSPVSNTSGSKVSDLGAWCVMELSDMEEDWEKDLDIELTEEDLREAEDLARKLDNNLNLEEEDWESWE